MNLQRYYAVGGSIVEVRPDVEIRNGQYVRAEDIAVLVEDERKRTDRLINAEWESRRQQNTRNLNLTETLTRLILYTESLEKLVGCERGDALMEANDVIESLE